MSSTAKNRIIFTIISLVAIAVLMFVPVISTFGGLFPGDENINYFKAMEYSFKNLGDVFGSPIAYYQLVVLLFLSVLCLYHLISALTGSKGAFLASSIICTVLWFAPIVLFLTADDRLEYLFDPDFGAYSFGMYILLLIFIASIIVASVSKSKSSQLNKGQYAPYVNSGYYPPSGGAYQPYAPAGQPYQQPNQQPYQQPAGQQFQPPFVPPVQQPEQPFVPPVQQPEQPFVPPVQEEPAPQPFEAPAFDAPAPEVNEAPAAAKFCSSCGAPVEEDGPFCGNCGAKL